MSKDADRQAVEKLATITEGQYLHVICPRCGADDASFRYRLKVAALVTCSRCDMTYVEPRLSSAELERKLQQWAEQDVLDDERLRLAFEPATLDYCARFLQRLTRHAGGPGRRLLDVGCSTGAFLSVARDAGWQVQGLEIGTASSSYARQVLNLDVCRGSLYDFDPPPASYDAIAMIEVIEHLPDPRGAMARVRGWLKPGGVLLATTPNFDSLYRRLHGTRWWVVNCEDEHIVLFTLETLCGMLQETGFSICEQHIQNLDVLGLLREFRGGVGQRDDAVCGPAGAVAGYYTARSAKARIKRVMQGFGALQAARALLRAMDKSYTARLSPTYAWGEQLVVVARRRE